MTVDGRRPEVRVQVGAASYPHDSTLLIWEPIQFYRCTEDVRVSDVSQHIYLFLYVIWNEMGLLSAGLC